MSASEARIASHIGLVPLACVAVAGAGLGTAWDLLHVRFGATIYAIGPDRQPLWVPIEFALVYLCGVLAIARIGRPHPDPSSPRRLAAEALWLTAVYATTAIGHGREWLVVGLVLATLAARRRSMERIVVRDNPLPAVALIAGGPVVEAVLIAAGVFRYEHASLGNVPVWLPLLYASAVPFAVRLTEAALLVSGRRDRA